MEMQSVRTAADWSRQCGMTCFHRAPTVKEKDRQSKERPVEMGRECEMVTGGSLTRRDGV